MMETYCALDFETANNNRASACEISVVRFEKGEPTATFTTLLRPPPELGEFIHTPLHGIREADCRNAPALVEVLPDLIEFIDNTPIVCHCFGFDMSVLRRTLDFYQRAYPRLVYGCTRGFARSILQDDAAIVSYALPRLCWHLNIDFTETHRAEADAVGCGYVAAALLRRKDCHTLEDLANLHGISLGLLGPTIDERFSSRGPRRKTQKERHEGVVDSLMQRLGVTTLDPGGDFSGKVVVLTGKLQSLTREDAEEVLRACGATVKSSVSAKTDMLIEGTQDARVLKGEHSSKHIKCMELKAKGKVIEVLDEKMFLENLGD